MTDETKPEKTEDVAEKTITLEEFKAWLQGVEDMQDDGWSPSATQWDKIRSKLFLIASMKTTTVNEVRTNPYERPAVKQPAYEESSLDNEIVSPRRPAPATTGRPKGPVMDDSGQPVKTPNVDTSSQDYVSSFL